MHLAEAIKNWNPMRRSDGHRPIWKSKSGLIYQNKEGSIVWLLSNEPLELTVENIGQNWTALNRPAKEYALARVMEGKTAIVFFTDLVNNREHFKFYKGGGKTEQGKPKFYSSLDLSQWETESNIPVSDIVYGVWYVID